MKLLFVHPDVSKSLGVLSKIVSKLNAILEQPETIQIEAIFLEIRLIQRPILV